MKIRALSNTASGYFARLVKKEILWTRHAVHFFQGRTLRKLLPGGAPACFETAEVNCRGDFDFTRFEPFPPGWNDDMMDVFGIFIS